MAIKKFLVENGKQVWPITRADCIYTVKGDQLLNTVVDANTKAIADEVARAKEAEKALADRLDVIEGEGVGSIKKAVADEAARIDGIVGNKAAEGVEATGLRKEIADAVQGVQDQLDDLVGDGEGSVADQIANAKEELQGAIDGVAEDLAEQMNAEVEGSLAKKIADEKAAQALVNEGFEDRIAANEAFVEAHNHKPMEDRIAALEELHKEGGVVEEAIKAVQDALDEFEEAQGIKDGQQNQAIQAAQKAAEDAQADVDALEEFVGKKAEGTNAASGLCYDIAKNAQDIAQEAVDRAAADAQIRTDFAAADAQVLVDAKAYADAKDLEDRNAQKLVDEAQDERIKALEDANKEDGAVAKAIAKVAQDLADFKGEQAEKEAAQDKAISDEAARAKGEEARIEGLVAAEKERAEGIEQGLAGRLDVIEGEGAGSIKKAVKDLADRHDQEMQDAADQVAEDLAALKQELQGEIDADVAAEAKLRDDADKALDERVKPLEAHVAAQPGVDAEQNRRIKALEDDAPVKQAAIEAAKKAADDAQDDVDAVVERLDSEGGLVDRIEANEADIARLDGAVDVEGSVKKQIKDAVDAINSDSEALEARVKANEDDIVEMKAEEAKIREDFAAADAQVLADAKKHADDAITALVDSAPDAMNTLNELAKAINDNKGIYDAYIEEHNTAMNNLKAELQKEIDDDVKVVADELAKQKDAEQAGTLANQIKVEKGRAEGVEAAIRQELANEKAALQKEIDDDVEVEKDRAEAAEKAINDEIANMKNDKLDGSLANLIAALQAQLGAQLTTAEYDGEEFDDLAPLS